MERSRARASEEAILLQDTPHGERDSLSDQEDGRGSHGSDRSGEWLNTAPNINGRREADDFQHKDGFNDPPAHRHCSFLPGPVRRWINGPDPPRLFKISPICPFLVRQQSWMVISISTALYSAVFITILALSISGCKVDGHGMPQRLSCVDQLWHGESGCGLNGTACRPFDNTSYAFRCPADCSRVRLLEPYAVGPEMINYRTLVIGGPTNSSDGGFKYRGDSFLCPAAIHAGVIPDHSGGVGIVELVGEQAGFPNVSTNGIDSIGFTPSFPLAFTFQTTSQSWRCKDPRWALLGLTILYNITISLFAQSAVFYAAIFTSGYFCISLAADAPEPTNYLKVVSLAIQGFLPATFIAYVIYKFYVKRTLSGLSGSLDQLVLWLGSFWAGALDNMTFDKLPLQRLIPHDIAAEPGALIALLGIVAFLVVGGVGQAWAFRLEGRLPQYLQLYCLIGVGIAVLAFIPDLNLRIHHYIIALLLLPGTALQTRPSLIYQGLLVGLFINGVARWGFASVLEVPEDLFRTGLHPKPRLEPASMSGNNITFSWFNVTEGYDSLSILVNDVERFRGYQDTDPQTFSWTRESPNESVYFRFAYTRHEAAEEVTIGDYSKPGTWLPDNRWKPIFPDDDE